MVDIATITAAIGAATLAVGLIDKISDQVARFITYEPEPDRPARTNPLKKAMSTKFRTKLTIHR